MKKTLLIAALTAVCFTVTAQDDNDDYELRGSEKYGYIVTSKGDKIEGIVRLMGDAKTPWANQKNVKFIAQKDIDPAKKRQKLKRWDTDDLKEYVAYDGDAERHFRLVKWVNTREAVTGDDRGLGGQLKTIKNVSNTRHMAEVLIDGKISVFRVYGYPASVAVGEEDIKRMERETQDLIDNPTILVQKDDGKVSTLQASDIKGLVKDCDMVKEKLAAGQYPGYDPAVQEKKKSAMGKLIKDEVDRAGSGAKLVSISQAVFTDYNANCK
jgi:hypothetical protein